MRYYSQRSRSGIVFNKEKYLGKWYEIARLDFKYERDLNNTTAEYSLNDNGTIKVDNQGYNTKEKKWEQAIGKAKFVGDDSIAKLKYLSLAPFIPDIMLLRLIVNINMH